MAFVVCEWYLKKAIMEKIAVAYPKYAEECKRLVQELDYAYC